MSRRTVFRIWAGLPLLAAAALAQTASPPGGTGRADLEAAARAAADGGRAYDAALEDRVAEAVARSRDSSHANMSRAASAYQDWQSETRQSQVEGFGPRARRALGMTEGEALPDASPRKRRQGDHSTIVFVSSSVPLPTLRAYAAQLEIVGGALAVRGVPGGSVSTILPLVAFVDAVTREDPRCEGADCARFEVAVLLDPVLFRAAGVERVPAVAITDRATLARYADHAVEDAPRLKTVTYGDAALSGHFAEQARLGVPGAADLLAQLEASRGQ